MTLWKFIRVEGGLLNLDVLERAVKDPLIREAERVWRTFSHENVPDAHTFLTALGWRLLSEPGSSRGITHRAEPRTRPASRDRDEERWVPLILVPPDQALDERWIRGRSPHRLMQQYLNATDHVWGLVGNGRVFRILRQNPHLTRPTYVEIDLAPLWTLREFDEFVRAFLLLRREAFPDMLGAVDAEGQPASFFLEEMFRATLEEGERLRDEMGTAVRRALEILGTFLVERHREALVQVYGDPINTRAFYGDLLNFVYRLLFLFVADARGYAVWPERLEGFFSVARLRRMAGAYYRASDRYEDLFLGMKVTFRLLGGALEPEILRKIPELHPLNGGLFRPTSLDDASGIGISNRALLEALHHLLYRRTGDGTVPVNYAQLDVEELGSVYESLLELHPRVDLERGVFSLEGSGERKRTGSYYTPPDLVAELVQSALKPVLEQKLAGAATPQEQEQALLSLRVLDPATGSGHFLLAAARFLGMELAKIREGKDEPSVEQYREAVRDVVERCIYGVDVNPFAAELCKVALWMESYVPGRPLSFLDHHIQVGDSLVGLVHLEDLDRPIPQKAYRRSRTFASGVLKEASRRNRKVPQAEGDLFSSRTVWAREFRGRVRALLREFDRASRKVEDIRRKEKAWAALQRTLETLRFAADLWVLPFFLREEDLPAPDAGEAHRAQWVPTTRDVRDALTHPERFRSRAMLYRLVESYRERHRFFHWFVAFPEVMVEGEGFDVVLGNPPFLGGLKISGTLGPEYRQWLKIAYQPFDGTADLCAAFFRRAFDLLRPGGRVGMVATNTISQGDTRESGLAVILKEGGVITFARRFVRWGEVAGEGQGKTSRRRRRKEGRRQPVVEVNLVAFHKPDPEFTDPLPPPVLDGKPVDFISSRLDPEPEVEPRKIPQNAGKAFIGDYVRGIGFVLQPEEARALFAKSPRNKDCLYPYLNGEDLNSHPEQKPSRWVICFHDWDLERARQYPDLFRIVEERVKPEREKLRGPGDSTSQKYWWRFHNYRKELREAIAPFRRVLARTRHSEYHMIAFVPSPMVYSDATVVFAFDDDYHFALLQSSIHEAWVWRQASTLESRNRYTPTDCFETFPFPPEEYHQMEAQERWSLDIMPEAFHRAARIGEMYHEHRRHMMRARQIGLTKTYNLFHDPECREEDVERLRELHVEMDRAILACYGWDDLELNHDFYKNARGQIRFTISPDARREVLHRLLELNRKLPPHLSNVVTFYRKS